MFYFGMSEAIFISLKPSSETAYTLLCTVGALDVEVFETHDDFKLVLPRAFSSFPVRHHRLQFFPPKNAHAPRAGEENKDENSRPGVEKNVNVEEDLDVG